jgi:hypothetical protein
MHDKHNPSLSGFTFKPALARRLLSEDKLSAIKNICLGYNFFRSGLGQRFRVYEPYQAQSKKVRSTESASNFHPMGERDQSWK